MRLAVSYRGPKKCISQDDKDGNTRQNLSQEFFISCARIAYTHTHIHEGVGRWEAECSLDHSNMIV